MARKKNPHVGSSLDEWLAEEGARDPSFARGVQEHFDSLQVARRVRALRQRRKVSQAELARRIGTKQPAIARLESGRVVPKLDLLEKVARALGAQLEVRFVNDG